MYIVIAFIIIAIVLVMNILNDFSQNSNNVYVRQ